MEKYHLKRLKDLAGRKSHQDFETDRELEALYSLLREIPGWKFWKWIPLSVKVLKAERVHRECCGSGKYL
jgi:hypothetical protein